MSEPQSAPPGSPAPKKAEASPATSGNSVSRLWSAAQFPLAILITLIVLAYLLWPDRPAAEEPPAKPEAEVVKRIDKHLLSIKADTPLGKKLVTKEVTPEKTSEPELKVFGGVVARAVARPEKQPSSRGSSRDDGAGEWAWDFNTPDLASAYSDWLKARHDVPFYEKQQQDIKKLDDETLKAKKEICDRLEKLVAAGTDPVKDMVAAEADYRQAVVQAAKDDHEAQTNLDNAKRTLVTLERQLFQAGMDPDLLAKPIKNMVIVAAEVPEGRISLVEQGQACTARFSAVSGQDFPGSVRSLSPTISKDRRTLRVFFQLDDPQGRLRPGMFAEIGLGTNRRDILRMPADGVLHVGESDYALVRTADGDWTITKIVTGEQYGNQIEVLEGLKPNDNVIGYGAILLKPYVVDDIEAINDAAPAAARSPPLPGEGHGVTANAGSASK